MERVLITGYKGFIGSAIFKQVKLENKYEVIGIDKEDLDITDKNKIELFFINNKIDYIIHTAALLDGTSEELIKANYIGTQNIFDAASKNNCKGIIFSSTFNVFNRSSYGQSKKSAELYLLMHNQKMKSVIIRCAGVFSKERQSGVIHNFINRAKEGKDINYVQGKVRFAYLTNVVKTNIFFIKHLKTMKEKSLIYSLASFEMNLNRLAKMIKQKCQSRSKINIDPIKIPQFTNNPSIEKKLKLIEFEDALDEVIK